MNLSKALLQIQQLEHPLINHTNTSEEYRQIYIFLKGSNHLDYVYRDTPKSWELMLDWDFGHRIYLGCVWWRSHKGTIGFMKDELSWNNLPEDLKNLVLKVNDVMANILISNSVKYIRSQE